MPPCSPTQPENCPLQVVDPPVGICPILQQPAPSKPLGTRFTKVFRSRVDFHAAKRRDFAKERGSNQPVDWVSSRWEKVGKLWRYCPRSAKRQRKSGAKDPSYRLGMKYHPTGTHPNAGDVNEMSHGAGATDCRFIIFFVKEPR
eukprot:1265261-Amorphochlora_amoeboformis.AAC.1